MFWYSGSIDAATPVFAVDAYDHTLPFYLRRDVTLVAVRDEFELGESLEPGRWIARVDDFVPRWQQLPQAAAYLSPETLAELRARGLPARVVYEDPRRVAILRR